MTAGHASTDTESTIANFRIILQTPSDCRAFIWPPSSHPKAEPKLNRSSDAGADVRSAGGCAQPANDVVRCAHRTLRPAALARLDRPHEFTTSISHAPNPRCDRTPRLAPRVALVEFDHAKRSECLMPPRKPSKIAYRRRGEPPSQAQSADERADSCDERRLASLEQLTLMCI
jgi:hypothetical protein